MLLSIIFNVFYFYYLLTFQLLTGVVFFYSMKGQLQTLLLMFDRKCIQGGIYIVALYIAAYTE